MQDKEVKEKQEERDPDQVFTDNNFCCNPLTIVHGTLQIMHGL